MNQSNPERAEHGTQADPSTRWPEEVRGMCRIAADPFGVTPEVHIEDFIFRFIYDNRVFAAKGPAVNYYFSDGAKSAVKVRAAIDRWVVQKQHPLQILEFAAGYGAVTRHAKRALEPHLLHSCDIHAQANEFNSTFFGVQTVQSALTPEELVLPAEYDAIFVLSFFSHMPRSTWLRWLQRLYAGLKGNGVLLFTTHGKLSMQYFPKAKLDETGYWFDQNSEQGDLDTESYGQTITSKNFVEGRIAELEGAKVLLYEQGGWWGHQDLYIIRKP